MRIREDSPFFGITEEQKELFLEEADELSYLRVAELWEMRSGRKTSEGQVKRFLQRLRYERAVRETDDSNEDLSAFAKKATDGKARDGLIEAARQKLFEEALASGNHAMLLELYRAANEERAREREVAVAQRKARAVEEHAKIGWMKVAGGREFLKAMVVSSEPVIESNPAEEPKLLPKLREVLTDVEKKPEERLAAALEFLESGDSGKNEEKLLGNGNGAASNGNEKKTPVIDWDAPLRALMAEKPFAHLMPKTEEKE